MARVTGNLELDGTTVKLNQGATTSQSIVAGSPSVASQVRLPNETDANTEVVTTFSNNAPSKRVKFDTTGSSASTTLTISLAQTTSQTLNIPDITGTDSLVVASATQELTNKTLVDPVIKTGSDTLRLQTTTGNTSPGATIVLDPNNASRTLDLSGNLTLGADLTTNSNNLTLNAASGGSTVTLPTTVNIGANLTTNSNALTVNAASGGSTVTLPSTVSIGADLTTNSHALTVNSATGGSTLTLPPTVNIGANLTTNSNALTVNAASGGSTLTLPTTADFSGGNVSTSGSVTIGANFTTNSHALTLNAASGGSTVDVPASGTLLSMASNLTTLPNTGNTTINHASSAELTFGSNISKVVIANDFEVQGTTTTINTTNLAVTDNNITLNNGGTKSSASGAGLTVDSSGDSSPWTTAPALLYNDTLTSGWELRKGDSTASELMTAARTLVRGDHAYGGGTITFNATDSSLLIQSQSNGRVRVGALEALLRVNDNSIFVNDVNAVVSGGSGSGSVTLRTMAATTVGNISLRTQTDTGTGNISISTEPTVGSGNITLDSTSAGGSGNIGISAKGSFTASGSSVSITGSAGSVSLTGTSLTVGTSTTNSVVIQTNSASKVIINHAPSSSVDVDIVGTRGIQIPAGDETQRPSGPVNGMFRYNSDTHKFEGVQNGIWRPVGSGSGQGGVNYIDNPDAEDTTTTGWVTYADAAANTPVDGTGGTASVTFTNTSSTPVRGTRSFLLTKDAANRQGQGASYNFSIDPADTGKQLTISLDYRTSAAYASGDVRVFIYDITNSVLIYPAVIELPKYDTAGSAYTFKTSFVSSTSTSYRLILHVATTNASAYTLTLDNIRVGPDQLLHSTPVTEWQSYVPTIGATTTAPTLATTHFKEARWRRVGDSMEIAWHYSQTSSSGAAAGSGTYLFNLPPGYIIDATKVINAAGTTNLDAVVFGVGTFRQASTFGALKAVVRTDITSTAVILVEETQVSISNSNRSLTSDNNIAYRINFTVPIASWAGSTVSVDNSQVEYAYNTTAWGDSSDTNPANTDYAPRGAAFNNVSLTAIRTRRVRFLTPIQSTDEIDVQVSSDNGRSFVSVAKGVILGVTSYVLPRFTYVDTGAGADTHGVGVTIVNANTGEVDVYFGRYFFRATDGAPAREWGDEINSNYRWRVVKSRNPLTIGGLTGTLWQQKFLTSSFSSGSLAEITALRFNNLEIGKTYRVTYNLYKAQSSGSNSDITTVFAGGTTPSTNRYALFTSRRGLTSGSYGASPADMQYNYSLIFVAETTTLYTYAATSGCAVYGEAWSPSKRTTNIILEELPLHQQTSKWT